MDKNNVYCKICDKETIYTRKTFAKHHLKAIHHINSQEYYDKFSNGKEGFCKTCNKPTSFRDIINGYAKFCSSVCSLKDKETMEESRRERLEKEKIKYAGKIYLQTDECKQKINETKIKRYGDVHYCNKEKIAVTKKEKYGDENYCNAEKIQKTILNRYGNYEYIVKQYQKAMLKKYGTDNYFKTKEFRNLMVDNGRWVSLEEISDYQKYRREVKKETRKWKKKIYELWDGLDYYDGKKLVTNYEWTKMNPDIHVSRNKDQPTIDHKTSIAYGWKNKISPLEIGNISNLCICSRNNNVTKNYKTETQHKNKGE